jgi:hypothetical protein
MAIKEASIDLGIFIRPWPSSSSTVDFKSQLEAKDVVITRLQEDVQNLLCETKEKILVISKQVEEIQYLHQIGSLALAMDDIQGPIVVRGHAQDANMLVYNAIIENVVATIIARIFKDIHTPVCKQPSIVPPLPRPTINIRRKPIVK